MFIANENYKKVDNIILYISLLNFQNVCSESLLILVFGDLDCGIIMVSHCEFYVMHKQILVRIEQLLYEPARYIKAMSWRHGVCANWKH